MSKDELDKLLEDLDLQGYTPYINRLDAKTASEFECEECGLSNLYGVGRKDINSYRCFSVCPDCGNVIEF